MRYQAIVGPDDIVPGKPFTDSEHTTREAETMRVMLEREREWARSWASNGGERAHIAREPDEDGRRHLLVVPDVVALQEARDVTAVGFFSRPREEVDHEILFSLEEELVSRMPAYAEMGLLSYYDVELVKGAYGNLILFATPEGPANWRENPAHGRAVEISPQNYHEIRLHHGTLSGRLLDGGTLSVTRTKYLDYGEAGVWRAVRQVSGAD
jgi:hypothetical protein